MPRENEQIGPYTLTRFLGRGGFGDVWQAVERTAFSSNEFALKFVRPDGNSGVDLGAVRAEVEKWQQASGHPNIMPFLKADVYGEHIVIVSEYADGGSLGYWLKQHGGRAPSVAEAARMARGILRGVVHLHGRKLLHRDLKPENVLLQGGHPRLIDFGISGVLSTRTDTKTLSGTLPYMPPEAFKKKKSEHTDIWAVGVILYQMLAGRLPFDAPDDASLMFQILMEKPDALPNSVPAGMCTVVMKALEKERADRFQTAAEMLAVLEQAMQPTIQPPTVIMPPRVVRPAPAPVPAPVVRLAPVVSKVVMPQKYTAQLPGGVGLEMGLIGPGRFQMGSPDYEAGRGGDEKQHWVSISKPFYMGIYPVTQRQWEAVMGNNPSYFKNCPDCPVEQVSWNDAQEFIQKLNGQARDGGKYRLPTEAEWEYGCRAGTETVFAYGNDLSSEQANFDGNYPHGKAAKGKYLKKTTTVGSYAPNGWGLYDMHGNVWEWCEDRYGSYPEAATADKAEVDPSGPTSGSGRVFRGGGWDRKAVDCRSARRGGNTPDSRFHILGFGLSRTPA